jgi:small subunit ribosomal protein S6
VEKAAGGIGKSYSISSTYSIGGKADPLDFLFPYRIALWYRGGSIRKEPSFMPSYETTVITKASASEDQIQALKSKVEGIIQAHQGQLGNFEDWGTRRLSFEIQKENRGRYLYFGFVGNSETVAELERNFRINENVVRFLSVNLAQEDDLELVKKPSPMKRGKRDEEQQPADQA